MLTDQEKREAIEKALGQSLERAMDAGDETHGQSHDAKWLNRDYLKGQILDALAEEAIVALVEVEHIKDASGWQTLMNGDFVSVPEILRPIPMFSWQLPSKHGKPGKATMIIIPEEASDEGG